MHATRSSVAILLAVAIISAPDHLFAQGTLDDYQRAMTIRDRYAGLALHVPEAPRWIDQTSRFYYRRTVKGGHEWMLVDGTTQEKKPAFDHARLATAIASATKRKASPLELPFTTFTFVEKERAIEFSLGGPGTRGAGAAGGGDAPPWRCSLETYTCAEGTGGRGGRGGRGGGGLAGPVRPAWDVNGVEPKRSPDGKFEALVNNYNVAIRAVGKSGLTMLTTDGSEGHYYDPDSLTWSPDSKKIAGFKVRPGHRRYVHYVESSPEDQLQPKHSTMQYAKPGDVLDVETPVLFHVDPTKRLDVDTALFFSHTIRLLS